MSTPAPLPRLRDLLTAWAGSVPNDNLLAAPWCGPGAAAVWLSRAAFALPLLALRKAGAGPCLWLPDYFCNESTAPARAAGVRLAFYPIGEDLTPRWDACHEMAARDGPPDLFVAVHTFGRPTDLAEARRFCDEAGAWLVEDGAHALRPEGGIGRFGDAAFYSPRKMLALPDGAVLCGRPEVLRGIAAVGAAPSTGVWAVKRGLQAAMPRLARAWAIRRRTAPFHVDPPPGPPPERPVLSAVSRRLLSRALPDLDRNAEIRRANHGAWAAAVAGWTDSEPFFAEAAAWTPYRFVLRARTPGAAADTYGRLRARGCPAESWPDLPPEVLANPQRHATALRLRRHLVLLPVHPGVTAADIRRWSR